MVTIYRAELENGYAEFLTKEEASVFSGDIEIIHREENTEELEKQLARQAIINEIVELELSITSRRFREALLTNEGKDWIVNVEGQITALREQLTGA